MKSKDKDGGKGSKNGLSLDIRNINLSTPVVVRAVLYFIVRFPHRLGVYKTRYPAIVRRSPPQLREVIPFLYRRYSTQSPGMREDDVQAARLLRTQ